MAKWEMRGREREWEGNTDGRMDGRMNATHKKAGEEKWHTRRGENGINQDRTSDTEKLEE